MAPPDARVWRTDGGSAGRATACEATLGGRPEAACPQRRSERPDRGHEGWLGSPALADLDGAGCAEVWAPQGNAYMPEIVVNLKDAVDGVGQVQIYDVAGAADNCLPWPTGRRDLARDGWVR